MITYFGNELKQNRNSYPKTLLLKFQYFYQHKHIRLFSSGRHFLCRKLNSRFDQSKKKMVISSWLNKNANWNFCRFWTGPGFQLWINFSGRDRGRLSVSRLLSLSWPLGKLVQIILPKMQELDDLTEQYAPDDYVQRQKLFR